MRKLFSAAMGTVAMILFAWGAGHFAAIPIWMAFIVGVAVSIALEEWFERREQRLAQERFERAVRRRKMHS